MHWGRRYLGRYQDHDGAWRLCHDSHHRPDCPEHALLWRDGAGIWYHGERIDNPDTHGTGCTLSSAIASDLAKGMELADAVRQAKVYISGALAAIRIPLHTGSKSRRATPATTSS